MCNLLFSRWFLYAFLGNSSKIAKYTKHNFLSWLSNLIYSSIMAIDLANFTGQVYQRHSRKHYLSKLVQSLFCLSKFNLLLGYNQLQVWSLQTGPCVLTWNDCRSHGRTVSLSRRKGSWERSMVLCKLHRRTSESSCQLTFWRLPCFRITK